MAAISLLSDDLDLYEALSDDAEVEVEGLMDEAELEEMVNATIEKLGFDDMVTQNVNRLQSKMRSVDRKHREVSRIFNDCEEILNRSGRDQTYTLANSTYSRNIPETIVCGSDSDDDLQVIDFEPSHGPKPRPISPRSASKNQRPLKFHHVDMPPPAGMRRPRPHGGPEDVQQAGMFRVADMLPQPPRELHSRLIQPQQKPVIQSRQIDLACGMKLYAKKMNEKWYKGTLIDIHDKDLPQSQRRYKVKFDGKGMKVVSGKTIAYHEHPTDTLPVGSRVIAMYRDDEESSSCSSFYAGIVAEPPSMRNNHRYLTFFDDGYAQYCTSKDLHKVYEQSKNVWEDIHPDSQEFIKGYLQQYPERPMVRLQKGQVVKTEWNGRWWVARVQEVDASLVKMHFEADRRVEWIYRGSTRLEPLYTELANAEASKLAGKGRRHNLNMKSNRKPIVEYLRGNERHDDEAKRMHPDRQKSAESSAGMSWPTTGSNSVPGTPEKILPGQDQNKKRAVARKSTARKGSQSSGKPDTPETPTTPILQTGQWWEKKTVVPPVKNEAPKDRPASDVVDYEEALGERIGITNRLPVRERTRFVTHLCGNHCIKELEQDISKLKGSNPLLFSQHCGWERQITKQKNTSKRVVFYRAPCGRRMRDLEETDFFLMMTNSQLTIDCFCFDPNLHTDTEYVPVKTFCDIKDLSYGKEHVPISCVNGIDRQYPDYVEYSNRRIPAKGVKLNLDEEFLSGCDCTDGCRDPSKCACIQMTIAATKVIPGLAKDNPEEVGFEFRRLKEPLISGIYECNSRCKCDSRCVNRVAQHKLQLRLQVFKTEKRGWGLRCLDDIPAGGFICVYAGQLLTEQGANEDGQTYGDEYLAELDYIEVVERTKDGYESDVNEDGNPDESEKADSEEEYKDRESDSTYSGERRYNKRHPKSVKAVKDSAENKEMSGKQKAQDWLDSLPEDGAMIVISDDEDGQAKKRQKSKNGGGSEPIKAVAAKTDGQDSEQAVPDKTDLATGGLKITEPTSLNIDDLEIEDSDEENGEKKTDNSTNDNGKLRRSTRTTTSTSRFRNLPDPKSQKPVSPLKINMRVMRVTKKQEKQMQNKVKKHQTDTRNLFGEEFCYVMDAKSMGNLGRYLNHSCSPNVFVQNVFVDTHDLRFPWVAFFAYQYIRAGTELTWDYNYEVGSVPGKILYCYCGSAECRGRLL